jgi:hypothetical protein
MGAWMLAVFATWLSSLPAEDFGVIPPWSPGRILAGLPDTPRREVGRTLGWLVQEGMPLARVRWLLGEHQPRLKPLPTSGLIGGIRFAQFDYGDYSLSVSFCDGAGGVLRVSAVSRSRRRSSAPP